MPEDKLKKILNIAKRRGFFWQSSLIYGGLSGFYDYAHLGMSLKRRWEGLWRRYFLGLDDNFHEIQTSYIMPEQVFRASGHLESFIDPVIKCKKCLNVERADQLLEEKTGYSFEGASLERLLEMIKKYNITCPKCGGKLEEIGVINMMFPVDVGVGKPVRAYLTPETAQGAYVNFKYEFEALRRRLPLGLAIIGRAFRNEISPRNVLMRMREFTQAELQIFFDPDDIDKHPDFDKVKGYKLRLLPAKARKSGEITVVSCDYVVKKLGLPRFYVYYMAKIQQFYLDVVKIKPERFRFRELVGDEKAFYNKYHWDIELYLDCMKGFKEVAGIHYRTDHDLSGHQKISEESMTVDVNGKKFIPHVVELSFGVDRNIFALFDIAYDEEEERSVLRFPRIISPLDAGVFPLVSRDGLPEKARSVYNMLKEHGFDVFYDESGSIGRRYRRIDEIGIPAGITIDYDTLKKDDVTLRDRDTMNQIRVKISDLPQILKRFLEGEKLDSLGKPIK